MTKTQHRNKISARVSDKTFRARPSTMSWGVWIDQLATRRPARSGALARDVDVDRLRHATWVAVNVDRIAKALVGENVRRTPMVADDSTLAQLAAILAELAEIRRQLELVTGDLLDPGEGESTESAGLSNAMDREKGERVT